MIEDRGQRTDQADVNRRLAELAKILNELTSQRFYGSVVIKFESGKAVHAKIEKSVKIDP